VPRLRWRPEDLRRRYYPPEFLGMYDRLRSLVNEHVAAGALVLDAGCGPGRVFGYQVRRQPRFIVGLDRDASVRENRNVDRPVRGDLEALPFRDASFDVVLLAHVLEHVARPEAVFGEVARVLKPGGRVLALTPNRWHYVALLARLLPHRLHVAVNRGRGLRDDDVFPTLYRANSAGRMRELVARAGLELERLDLFETEPEYLAFHSLAYAVGVGYERLVNRFDALSPLRVNIMLVARKPPSRATAR
jgi:SAM-dependent methyltransferase